MTRFRPEDEQRLVEIIAAAVAQEEPLELVAGGSKRRLGRPQQLPHIVDLSAFAGIRDYEPAELVLTAGAATPMSAIEAALAAAGQMLAFEPPDWRALLGSASGGTLGGAVLTNLSGPRRIKAGAARDHFLGFRGVSGRGEAFKAGGKVVKNVTGYDLAKLVAGSFGTLVAVTEVTLKVLPRAPAERSLVLRRLDDGAAQHAMTAALSSPHEVSGAAHLPRGDSGHEAPLTLLR
ncbi:MAG TPA: FAD-binding protein, partial [Stellaceae bacterium]|nr:FAD-binding protein [Stellaceae bacterium]